MYDADFAQGDLATLDNTADGFFPNRREANGERFGEAFPNGGECIVTGLSSSNFESPEKSFRPFLKFDGLPDRQGSGGVVHEVKADLVAALRDGASERTPKKSFPIRTGTIVDSCGLIKGDNNAENGSAGFIGLQCIGKTCVNHRNLERVKRKRCDGDGDQVLRPPDTPVRD